MIISKEMENTESIECLVLNDSEQEAKAGSRLETKHHRGYQHIPTYHYYSNHSPFLINQMDLALTKSPPPSLRIFPTTNSHSCYNNSTVFFNHFSNHANHAVLRHSSKSIVSYAQRDAHMERSSLESLFCYDKAVPEEIIEKPVGISLVTKNIGANPLCNDCQAKGAVLCATCSGSGLYVDSILESQGIIVKVRCLGCGGTGNIMCCGCGGRGHL